MKTTVVCTHCGSNAVVCDASASFDVDSQEWVLSSVYDNTDCTVCEGECKTDSADAALYPGELVLLPPGPDCAEWRTKAPNGKVRTWHSESRAKQAREQHEWAN